MRLLLNKDLAKKKDNLHEMAILVISTRKELRETISQHISLAGISRTENLGTDFLSGLTLTLPANLRGVLIDIGQSIDVDRVMTQIKSQIPKDCWCMLFGDSDSITIAQRFAERGIRYFHANSQLAEIAQKVIDGPDFDIGRKSVFISMLGCKGGAGTTLLSYQLSQSIVQHRKLPLLLLQGGQGSQNLDIILGQKIDNNIAYYQENIDAMLSQGILPPDMDAEEFQKYNFVVFDQALFNATKEQMIQQAELSHCIVLILDRSMSSARVALNFIQCFERIKENNKRPKRLFICVNDNSPATSESLSSSDIQSLLSHPVNFNFPYIKRGSNSIVEHKLWSGAKKPLEKLTRMIMGIDDSKKNAAKYALSRWFN